ncbi:MAG: hypothetical protein HeimC2_24530 [Candidatus Heimdallarchaeota archaeon LC_2]|nr:MAG: hypothetical protein HeimC2_24530 [Candidatus Heimdallarchaeota archaeon LC_2]
MELLLLVYLIIGIYFFSNLVVFFLMINNPFKYRDINYTLPFGIGTENQKKKFLTDPMVRYWICHNPQDKMKNNWVIFFHDLKS